ncbi:MAG: response regulator [Phormidesmis sp.]
MLQKQTNILLIEDSPTDASILKTAFASIASPISIQVATDSLEALAILRNAIAKRQMPHLILLDLNLPGKSGHEVIEEVKSHAQWKITPTIVLSSSSTPADILESYELRANAYLTKPSTLAGYELIAEHIHSFWIEAAQLPANQY